MRVNYSGHDYQYDAKTNTYSRRLPKVIQTCSKGHILKRMVNPSLTRVHALPCLICTPEAHYQKMQDIGWKSYSEALQYIIKERD